MENGKVCSGARSSNPPPPHPLPAVHPPTHEDTDPSLRPTWIQDSSPESQEDTLAHTILRRQSDTQQTHTQHFTPCPGNPFATLVFCRLHSLAACSACCSVQPSPPNPPVFKTQSASHISSDPLLPPSSLLSIHLQSFNRPFCPTSPSVGTPPFLQIQKRREKQKRVSLERPASSTFPFPFERLEDSPLCAPKAANLDFEARVPVPFSVFPSTYKESETQTQTQTVTQTHEELEIKLPEKKPNKPGREESQYSSFTTIAESKPQPPQQQKPQQQQQPLPPRKEQHRYEEEVRIEEHYHRPGVHYESHNYREEYRSPIKTSTDFSLLFLLSSPAPPAPAPAPSQYTTQQEFHDTRIHHHDTRVEIDTRHHEHLVNPIDKIERQYRQRFQPTYHKEEVTVETYPAPHHHHHHSHSDHHSDHHSHHQHSHVDEYTVESERPRPQQYKETIKVTEETIEPTHVSKPQHKSSKMGYYDEDGHYHSFRQGLHKLADKIAHPHHHHHHHHGHADRYEVSEVRAASAPRRQSSGSGSGAPLLPNTVTIPCHHIRLGDFLMLQGRPCQVIKISTSAATGQYRYLGVDLFTKQLHEESSFIANPAPSVVVQTMLGPVFKQYRVLDLADGHVTAMTETGDVKQGLPVIDQSNLWSRLNNAFESGRGSVRVLVLNDAGRELAVDVKVIHGSRL
ncbi:hypothetical protein CFIO01_05069 [Colletotrichum fioriniae PJ7]|uniref:Uncharacterized protein n=1 Tax=Colletotrichum fioriniae PJ7 TaxID=1445577 RepID=A0A010QJA0_9PEZI|nr:hypothetical protein CFIO01_05069 [Colletotrichum fioriniae PJ7]